MKLSDENFMSVGLSGKKDDMIFYQRFGKTFIRKASGSYNKIPTEKQAIVRAHFIEAHHFAQSVINDPVKKAIYEKKAKGRCTAYSKAVSEYLILKRQNPYSILVGLPPSRHVVPLVGLSFPDQVL